MLNAPDPMSNPPSGDAAADAARLPGPRLSIGALSRATGIPVETLRTWETRYGFPGPERKPSGHRVYPAAIVPRLRRVAAALARGHRASECVGASDEQLNDLLGVSPDPATGDVREPLPIPGESVETLIDAVAAFDADGLTRMLLAAWARFGPMPFVGQYVAPLVSRVGEEWSAGRLQVTHEHFLSERLADVLRTLRLPFDARADGPLVLCATMPGERHALGLQMAALVAAVSGWRVLYLGTEVPPEQVAATAAETGARAVALSVSRATGGAPAAAALAVLRQHLATGVRVLVGGDGAPADLDGVETIRDFERFRQRLETLGTGAA